MQRAMFHINPLGPIIFYIYHQSILQSKLFISNTFDHASRKTSHFASHSKVPRARIVSKKLSLYEHVHQIEFCLVVSSSLHGGLQIIY